MTLLSLQLLLICNLYMLFIACQPAKPAPPPHCSLRLTHYAKIALGETTETRLPASKRASFCRAGRMSAAVAPSAQLPDEPGFAGS